MKVRRLSEEYLQDLGRRIRLVRTYLNMEQRDLAESLQTSQSQLSRIEAGATPPNLYHLLKIKELADRKGAGRGEVTWEWLMEGKGMVFMG